MKNYIDVVAALIRDGDKFLICKRPPYKSRGGLWEFVGGKVEPGETKEQALKRECYEELLINIRVKGVFATESHEYPDINIRLTVFESEIESGVITLTEHTEAKFITPAEIKNYKFCPADENILHKLLKTCKQDKTL